jgi:hypothetical protein
VCDLLHLRVHVGRIDPDAPGAHAAHHGFTQCRRPRLGHRAAVSSGRSSGWACDRFGGKPRWSSPTRFAVRP